jgi:hypothetical protein
MKAVTTRSDEPGSAAATGSTEPPVTARAFDRVLRPRIEAGILPSRATLIAIGAAALVAIGQLAEDIADSPPLQMLPPAVEIPRWTVVAVAIYVLVIARLLDVTVRRSLPSLRPAVRIDDATFAAYAQRMRSPGLSTDILLLTLSAVLVTVLFLVIRYDLPIADPVTGEPRFLPGDSLGGIATLLGYAVLGWAGLVVVYSTIRFARTLADLSREPLAIDVFDPSNLLPFGTIALTLALAPAGIIVILLLGLGLPGGWLSWAVLLLATLASLLALFLPLRCVHQQMAKSKYEVIGDIDRRLSRVYAEVTDTTLGTARMAKLMEAVNTLVPLRKTAHEVTTWPFRDTVAFGRAVLIASAPLVYAALSELIRVFWIAPMGR